MYEPVQAFAHNLQLRWVTIGDGRFGLDSIRIRNQGFSSVLPTDIGSALLEQAVQRGLINEYQVENAERLSFADESFDVAFCKESYHHFPRGPLALYEMLRVAKHAVVLVEPRDYSIDRPVFPVVGPVGLVKGIFEWAKRRLRLHDTPLPLRKLYHLGDPPCYEDSGNYVYTISSREMEKVALGMNLPVLAVKGLNDHHQSGYETETIGESSELFHDLKLKLAQEDRLSRAGRIGTSMLMTILFKTTPDVETRRFLIQNDWLVVDLPRNPHV
ncbi:hypothetical protein Poly24_32460 [Rosistilla carotiformis]|uniref:Methyltransferase type 11 domain-containing protein n=2 Tax=Rosistilla carotiformis TaxID=2528017 RepID=A0A518JVF8_9BACT|nr:hypothetical protein Poly24_32460 [Rosistilla carotiformis]